MQPSARLRLPDSSEVVAHPGSLLGRSWTADVRIDDGRISEAHAFVSLRAGRLVLLPLRGRVRIGDRDVPRVELEAGQTIDLAPGLTIEVLEVQLPPTVLAVALGDGPAQILTGVTSVLTSPHPHVSAGSHADAVALLWSDGLAWRLQRKDRPTTSLRGGERIEFETFTLKTVDLASEVIGVDETQSKPQVGQRVHLRARYDSAQIWHDGMPEPLVLKGQQARLVSELLALGGPTRWTIVARALWSDVDDPMALRHRLDVALAKLRRRLDTAGIRRSLVTAHNNGHLELLLYPGDRAEDLS